MGPGKYEGRLELTWTNKHLRLLAQDDGTYEWVNPADYRVAEVRLLHSAGAVGKVGPEGSRARDNLLIKGDALNGLTSLAQLPEFASEYLGKVKLAYLDPPFNTQQSFLQYDDALEHSVWLTMMRDRLLQIKALLSPEGSVWVHCDDSEQHRLRCVMDEIFGADKFIACVIWQKRYSRDNRPAIGPVHDFILVYAPSGQEWKNHRNRILRESATQYRNPNNDPRGLWRPIPMTAQGYRPNQMYEIVSPAGVVHKPPKGRCWSMVRERLDELLSQGRIYFGQDGASQPNVIRYLDEDEGLVPWTWWPHVEVGHTDEAKKEILNLFPDVEAFQTPKPERLMQRIIHIASDPGDTVLDCFAGSGTTGAVSQKLRRHWVLIERDAQVMDTYAVPRLLKVVTGEDPGGITESAGWEGGGGIRILEIANSMFESEGGLVFLAEWMTNGALAEATAAQLGYKYEDDPPFAGRKGRTRLSVVDGVVNDSVVRLLTGALANDERLVVCGTAIDPEVRALLKDLRPGSTMRKIPAALLARYRQSDQLRFDVAATNPIEGNGGPSGKEANPQRRKLAT
ncbi:MAG: site-specific DNA-methyltransferase [Acidimicrobiia bacterium]